MSPTPAPRHGMATPSPCHLVGFGTHACGRGHGMTSMYCNHTQCRRCVCTVDTFTGTERAFTQRQIPDALEYYLGLADDLYGGEGLEDEEDDDNA